MDYGNTGLFSMLKGKMAYSSQRQQVIARNIANIDTQGYRAQDLKAPDFARALKGGGGLALATTQPGHLAPRTGSGGYRAQEMPASYDATSGGNNVELEEQTALMAENKAEYDLALNLYQKTKQLLKTAVGNQ